MSLRRTPFYRVMHRHNLFLGGDREMVLTTALAAATLALLGQNLPAVGVALVLWFGTIWIFREMAKHDPQARHVYVRHIKYRGYYPARSRPYRTM